MAMETPIEVLRIEQSVVSKELSRFRACDANSRSFYCREWAQYIYKKHFVWNAKTQEDMQQAQPSLGVMSTGHYSICMLQPPSEAKRKERSPKLSEQFEKLLEQKSVVEGDEEDEDDHGGKKSTATVEEQDTLNAPTLTQDIIQACTLWQSLPSSLSGLPSIFEPVQFNPFPDHIPLDDDPKAPAQLLDPLIIVRQALCLPSEGFHLLKNLTGDILLSHTQPTCLHVKPDDPSPADLELDRQMLNDDLQTITTQVLAAMDKRLTISWQPLLDFLRQLNQLEERRNRLMGQQCQATVDAFVEQQQLVSFATVWQQQPIMSTTKESMIGIINMVETYLNGLITNVQLFLNDFVVPRLEKIGQLIQDLWDLVGPTIQHMAERMATHEERDKGNAENCKAVSQSLKGLHSTKEVDEAIDRIQHAMADRVDEYVSSVQKLKSNYDLDQLISTTSQLSLTELKSKVEKIQHKDFRKKVKRLETGYTSLRQFFRYEVTQKIFPETLFCKFSLVCLGALMQEGEVMEAMIIETEVKRFIETHRSLVKRRQSIVLQYEEGVQIGRRELAGILGKLFLKEGMRIQGESLALKRQAMLLKSMGSNQQAGNTVNGKADSLSKKKKKNKKKKAQTSVPSSTQVQSEEDAEDEDHPVTETGNQELPLTTATMSASTSTSSSATITIPSSPCLQSSLSLPAESSIAEAQAAVVTAATQQQQSASVAPQAKKKNKVITIPPSPQSTYVPPASPITATINPATINKSNGKNKTASKLPSTPSSAGKIVTNSKAAPSISASTKKLDHIPGISIVTTSPAHTTDSKHAADDKTTKKATKSMPNIVEPDKVMPEKVRKEDTRPLSTAGKATDTADFITTDTTSSKKASSSLVSDRPVHRQQQQQQSLCNTMDDKKVDVILRKDNNKDDKNDDWKSMVQQLQRDRHNLETKMVALQQDMSAIHQQYADKMKEQQQQAWQWYEQHQVERKEMQLYIQQLESQLKHHHHQQKQQQQQQQSSSTSSTSTSSGLMSSPSISSSAAPLLGIVGSSAMGSVNGAMLPTTPTLLPATISSHLQLSATTAPTLSSSSSSTSPPSSLFSAPQPQLQQQPQPQQQQQSHHWLTAGFGNQDLFAGYRQEMQSFSPLYQPQQQKYPAFSSSLHSYLQQSPF